MATPAASVRTRLGVVLRTTVTEESMREIGRATMGVRLMKVADDDSIVSVIKIMNESAELAKAEGETKEAEQNDKVKHAEDIVEKLKKGGLEALGKPPESKRMKKAKEDEE